MNIGNKVLREIPFPKTIITTISEYKIARIINMHALKFTIDWFSIFSARIISREKTTRTMRAFKEAFNAFGQASKK